MKLGTWVGLGDAGTLSVLVEVTVWVARVKWGRLISGAVLGLALWVLVTC